MGRASGTGSGAIARAELPVSYPLYQMHCWVVVRSCAAAGECGSAPINSRRSFQRLVTCLMWAQLAPKPQPPCGVRWKRCCLRPTICDTAGRGYIASSAGSWAHSAKVVSNAWLP